MRICKVSRETEQKIQVHWPTTFSFTNQRKIQEKEEAEKKAYTQKESSKWGT